MLVRHRTHDASHRQAVKIVINKDQNTQGNRRKLCACPCLNMSGGPLAKRRGTSGAVHHGDHDTQNNQEYQNADIVRVRKNRDHAILKRMCQGALKAEAGIHHRSGKNSDKQGTVNLLGNKRQRNGNNRRNQRPERLLDSILIGGRRPGYKDGDHTDDSNQQGDPVSSHPFCFFFIHLLSSPSFFQAAGNICLPGIIKKRIR